MKYLTLNLLMVLTALQVFGQKLPGNGISYVRIKNADFIVEAEINPIKKDVLVKTDRYYFWYTLHQINKTQGGFSGKLLNGAYREFYLNKNLKEAGLFKNGLKTGTWKSWNQNGTLHQLANWSEGKKNGKYQNYDENEQLIESGNYRDNQLDGESKFYKNKELAEIKNYKHGVLLP